MNEKHIAAKKLTLSIVVFALALLAIFGTIDHTGQDYTNESFKRALITFGIARGLNGVISVAQGTEIAVQPAGVGMNFTPGQILDPINDLVEQFSWVMLASSASLGIQKVLLAISSTQVMTVALLVVFGLYLVFVWRPDWFAAGAKSFIVSTAIIILFVRFSVPLVAIGSESMYSYFLHDQYVESSKQLEKTQQRIGELSSDDNALYDATDKEGLLDMAKRLLDSASIKKTINNRIDRYKELAADATENAINLIVVFIIETIVFPLLFLGLLYRGSKALWSRLVVL
ncbi:MAG: hypothetical protein PVJ39_19090 [Gammaproteobacteria bacterium]|jgi:hypothetical protein